MLRNIMEESSYRGFKTSRGVNYHYYRVEAQENRQTLLFCHGFPSTSYDWRYQVPFFRKLGYGLIIPDMLGYGGTDRPKDSDEYKMSLQTKDFNELLDCEGVPKCVIIAHDWGCLFASHMIIRYPHRFLALALLAGGFMPPAQKFDPKEINKIAKERTGHASIGYQEFFIEDGAEDIIAEHYALFEAVLYPEDPAIWKEVMLPVGAMKAFLLSGKRLPSAPYATKEEKQELKDMLLKDNLHGGLQWYKAAIGSYEDAAEIPPSQYEVKQPVLFVGASQDYVCIPELMAQWTQPFAKNLKVTELDTSHWVMLEKPDQLNEELLGWLEAEM